MQTEANISRQIKLNRLSNIRDLGGMRTEDGRTIKPGMLIRSGQLYFTGEDQEDIDTLRQLGIRKIYDFRSLKERDEKPDPCIGEAENLHIPTIKDLTAGISRDQESDRLAIDMIVEHSTKEPGFALKYMEDTYLCFVRDDFAISQYRRFLQDVLDCGGPVLWHCTAGKDRAGFAAVLIETILGVSREDVIKDYLSTNDYIAAELEFIMGMLGQKMDLHRTEHEIRYLFRAENAYLAALFDYTEKNYGGFDTFIKEQLGVDERMAEAFREKYLTADL